MVLGSSLTFLLFETRRVFEAFWSEGLEWVLSCGKFVVKLFLVGSVGELMMMVILFGSAHTLHFTTLGKPEFTELIQMDKRHWPGRLLWHGWLPALAGIFFWVSMGYVNCRSSFLQT